MGKLAVITDAGPGFGRATVKAFARQGYDVALLSCEPTAGAGDSVRLADQPLAPRHLGDDHRSPSHRPLCGGDRACRTGPPTPDI